jgi:hypothetical protein
MRLRLQQATRTGPNYAEANTVQIARRRRALAHSELVRQELEKTIITITPKPGGGSVTQIRAGRGRGIKNFLLEMDSRREIGSLPHDLNPVSVSLFIAIEISTPSLSSPALEPFCVYTVLIMHRLPRQAGYDIQIKSSRPLTDLLYP